MLEQPPFSDGTIRYRTSGRWRRRVSRIMVCLLVVTSVLYPTVSSILALVDGRAVDAVSLAGVAAVFVVASVPFRWLWGPYEGELTSSGVLRFTRLSGTQEGHVTSVRRVSRKQFSDLATWFEIEWEYGKTTLLPSLLVEGILDANPTIEVRDYGGKQRQRARKRLGIYE